MKILRRWRPRIVRAVEAALAGDDRLAELLRYPLGLSDPGGGTGPGVGGKLVRPALTCFGCYALGGRVERALPLAAALELVHNFSLVHDDIQDGDDLRRGRPTVWKAFGKAQAINVGDGLLVVALGAALRGGEGLDTEAVVAAGRSLLAATYRMIEGQVLDLGLEGETDGGVEAYLTMARKKTGALLGCGLELGAVAAGMAELAPAHREVGEVLGLAFQVGDDLLGIWGDPERTGKPAGGDLMRRKRSWPLSFALERDPGFGELLNQHPVPVERLLERLESLGARRAAQAAVEDYCRQARTLAQGLPWQPPAHRDFEELLNFLVQREV
ncbi:MAG: polyprenyl synthetase family protein [Candidatus Bipolaricaulaceae bacterium]